MAELFVINSLNSSKSVKFNVGFRSFVVKGDQDGDQKWVLEIGTTHSGIDGSKSLAKRVHNIAAEDLDQVLEDALAELCGEIDWAPLINDTEPPKVDFVSPQGMDIPVGSIVQIKLSDVLPSAGIDLSSMSVMLDIGDTDFDITNEIQVIGDPYAYELLWIPPNL